MPYVPVVMLVAAAAVLVGVIAVALGRGGELGYFQPDYAPLRLDEVNATDVVLFRPNFSLWGYSVPATDEALNRIADALTERDIEINALRRQVNSMRESPRRLFRDDPGPEAFPDLPGPGPTPGPGPGPGPGPASAAVRDDEGTGRLLSGPRGEPSGLGWTDPPGRLRFSDDQLSGTTPTGSGFPSSRRPGSGLPSSGFPGSGLPSSGTTPTGSGFPGSRRPGSGLPSSGFPGSGLPSSDFPGSGLPSSDFPGSGLPLSGSPGSGLPSSGLPSSGQAGAHPWSPAFRPPAGRPPWPPAVKPATGPEPPGPPSAFPPATELPRRRPPRGPAVGSPPAAPSSATDDPPDFPGREPRPPRPAAPPQAAPPQEEGW